MWFSTGITFLSLFALLPSSTDCIDIDDIGQLGFAGNYAGISNAKSTLQFESLSDTHLIQQKDSVFEKIAAFNGNITSYCTLENDIYFGGQFETVNETLYNHIVKYDTQSNQFQALGQGINGSVYSLYCDDMDRIVYVGGNFTEHAIQWDIKQNQWTPVPWKGFNGPVYTITKNKQYNSILFGGRFDATGDGQFFNSNTSQLVPLSSPTVNIIIDTKSTQLPNSHWFFISLYLQEMELDLAHLTIPAALYVHPKYHQNPPRAIHGTCKTAFLGTGMQTLSIQLNLPYSD